MEDDDIQVSSDDESPASASPSRGAAAAVDKTDPEAVVRKQQITIWVAPDWTDWSDSKRDGWQEVKAYSVMHQDGRKVIYVAGAEGENSNSLPDGTPYMSQIGSVTVDKDQEARFTRAVKDANARKPPPPTRNILMPDGKVHIMERDPATGEYTIDRGLAATQPPVKEQTPKPSPATNWQPLKTPDGKVVALVDPATGETVPVSQKDPAKPNVFETKDGRIYTVDPEGKTATDITPEKPGDKPISDKAPRYVPDYSKPDLGLTEYNERLKEAHRAGIIDADTGRRLIQAASDLAVTTATHGGKLADQARAIYNDEIGQRRDTLGEVKSRRDSADGQFRQVDGTISKYGSTILPGTGTGQTVVDAYRGMLETARGHVEAMGGLQEVPEVEMPPSLQSIRNIRLSPDGSIEIVAPTGPAPAPAAAAPAGAPGSGQRVNANDKEDRVPSVPVNPLPGEPGHDPTKPVGMLPGGGMMMKTMPEDLPMTGGGDYGLGVQMGTAMDGLGRTMGSELEPTHQRTQRVVKPSDPAGRNQATAGTFEETVLQPGLRRTMGTATDMGPADAQKLQRLLDLGLDEDDARNALALYRRGVRADQL